LTKVPKTVLEIYVDVSSHSTAFLVKKLLTIKVLSLSKSINLETLIVNDFLIKSMQTKNRFI